MASESDETVVAEEAPKRRIGALPMIVVPLLLAIALIVGVVGGIVSYQSAKALRAELVTVKKEIKELKDLSQQKAAEDNTLALDAALKDLKLQVETLTKQIAALMESVAAHSTREDSAGKPVAGEGKVQASSVRDGGTIAQEKGKVPDAKVHAKPSDTSARTSDVRNCDLIGKSPEEQAAILKRCVGLIDPPSAKGAPSP